MEMIKTFHHQMFGEIRTMTNEKGEVFFVGKDVAQALGYSKPQNAIATHVDEEDKTTASIQGTSYEISWGNDSFSQVRTCPGIPLCIS